MDSQTEHVTKTQLGQICSIECSVLAFSGEISDLCRRDRIVTDLNPLSPLSYNLDMGDAEHLLQTGSMNGYQWLVSSDRQFDVLECCPDVVLGKYVAIPSFDSGPLRLTEGQKSTGWVSQGEIAYSPEIQHVNVVPQTYFSELYVFGSPTNLGALADPNINIFGSEMQKGQVIAFVNFDFGFHDSEYADVAHRFWQQLTWISPESYLAENDYLIFVTANPTLFAKVYEALRQAG